GACCPTCFGIVCKPALNTVVALVRRPHQCDKDIHVQQVNGHLVLASRSRTCSVVTRGESGGKSKTRIPLTMRGGWDARIPLRTSSETARPRPNVRFLAYAFTSGRTSSSRFRVVLIVFRDVTMALLMLLLPMISSISEHLMLRLSRPCASYQHPPDPRKTGNSKYGASQPFGSCKGAAQTRGIAKGRSKSLLIDRLIFLKCLLPGALSRQEAHQGFGRQGAAVQRE